MPVTPHFLLSGHLNLYLPNQNSASCTTTCPLRTNMWLMATQYATQLLKYTYIHSEHTGKHTHISFTILLPPFLTTPPN